MAAWNTLSDREKDLDRKISEIGLNNFESTRCFFDLSENTINAIMKKIGAFHEERSFIVDRMKIYVRVGNALNRADGIVESTEYMLDVFTEEDEKWLEKLKEFGIDI